jgi:hypothetical protein
MLLEWRNDNNVWVIYYMCLLALAWHSLGTPLIIHSTLNIILRFSASASSRRNPPPVSFHRHRHRHDSRSSSSTIGIFSNDFSPKENCSLRWQWRYYSRSTRVLGLVTLRGKKDLVPACRLRGLQVLQDTNFERANSRASLGHVISTSGTKRTPTNTTSVKALPVTQNKAISWASVVKGPQQSLTIKRY